MSSTVQFSLAVAGTVGFTLLWIYTTPQKTVDRAPRNAALIAIKLMAANAGWFYLLCMAFEATAYAYLLSTAIIFLFAAAVSYDSEPSTGENPGFAIAALIIFVLFIAKQLILGFPDRDRVILVPEAQPIDTEPPQRKADVGVVVSPLRPTGKIEIAGEEFSAASQAGTMISAGVRVRVTGNRGKSYLVAALDDKGEHTA